MSIKDKLSIEDRVTMTIDRVRKPLDDLRVTGTVRIDVLRADGRRESQIVPNAFTTAGKSAVRSYLTGISAPTNITRMAFENGGVQQGSQQVTTNADFDADTARFTAAFTGFTGSIDGASLYNTAATTQFAQTTFTSIGLAAADTLTIQWDLNLA